MKRRAFRAAALTLEIVERRRVSFDKAFLEALGRVGGSGYGRLAYDYALLGILHYRAADRALSLEGLENTPLRRRCAFRVAYGILKCETGLGVEDVASMCGGLLSKRMLEALRRHRAISLDDLVGGLPEMERIAIRYSVPTWLVERLARYLGRRELERLLKALARRILWVRANTLRAKVDDVAKKLMRIAKVKRDRDYDFMFEILEGHERVLSSTILERGEAVVHDKASTIVVDALSPEAGEIVLDMAAAPGIKTSLISQLTSDSALVVAADVSTTRTLEMRRLLARLGVRNAHPLVADSTRMAYGRSFDRVLLDAPCSNTGAIATDPGLRISLREEERVSKFVKIQRELLRAAISAVKRGGCVVFSTCSLLPEEGELVVERVASELGLDLETSGVPGSPGYRGFRISERVKRLFPHRNRTAGFFVAKICT